MRIQIIKDGQVTHVPAENVMYSTVNKSILTPTIQGRLHLVNKETLIICERETPDAVLKELDDIHNAKMLSEEAGNQDIVVTVLYIEEKKLDKEKKNEPKAPEDHKEKKTA